MALRIVRCAIAGLLVISCAGAGIDEGRLAEAGAGIDEGLFSEEGAGTFPETAMEEYDALARLEENPIDPKLASREMLLAIPGFPSGLASRVVRACSESRSGSRWLVALTPPEREMLYRFGRFLILPRRRLTRIRTRLGRGRIGTSGSERTDGFLSVENERWKVRLRYRSAEGGRAVSPYLSWMCMQASLNLCGGDFHPDYAMGLLFNGSPYFYPFSAGFPIRGRRWIVPAPSWYGEALRGCAVEVWRGPFRGMFFAGRPRTYTGRDVEIGEQTVCGGRGSAAVRGGEVGVTVRRHESDRSGPLCAFDCRWRAGKVLSAAECVAAGPGAGAGTWGVSMRGGCFDIGLVTYRVPYGFCAGFSAVPGGEIRVSSWQRGCVAVVSGRIWGRSVFRTSYERYVSGEAEESRMRDSARLELEMRRGRETLKLSYRRRLRRSERGIPYPASGTSIADGHQEGQLLLTIRRGAVNRIRLSSRFKAGEGESGYLVAASVRFGFLRRRVRFTAASCLYRALSGEPVQYVYEPVLEGSYPWVRVKGNGSRGTVIVEVRWRDLAVSFRAVTGAAPIGTEFGLMAAYRR